MTRDRLFMAFLASGAAVIAAAVYAYFAFGPVAVTLVMGWQLVFWALAFLLYRRGPLR